MKRSLIISLITASLLSASACSASSGGNANEVFSQEDDSSQKYDRAIPDNITEPYIPSHDLLDGSRPGSNSSNAYENSLPAESSEERTEDESSSSHKNDYVVVTYESSIDDESYYENSSFEEKSPDESSEDESNYHSSTENSFDESSTTEYSETTEESSEYEEESSDEESSVPFDESSSEQSSELHEEEISVPEITVPERAPEITEVRSTLSSFTVSWPEDQYADGYIVQYSQDKKFSDENTNTVSTYDTTLSVYDLDEGDDYFVRYCSYRSDAHRKTYSGWSTVKYIKIREMSIVNGLTYIDGVLIVNKTYSVPADYGSGLTDKTAEAFNQMAADAAADGITLWIASGFRSYNTQKNTYSYFVNDRGVDQADRASARPGHSEHQTGLAIDVNSTSDYFQYTPEAEWLKENCYKYGFIIRYPEGKEEITGYKYEPWHIRFVGVGKAEKITNSGLTIEEYYGITSQYQE